ncbi:MAG: type I secretion C-terminal target domain-containing protein, partial [Alphaproteobacteria bacterium]
DGILTGYDPLTSAISDFVHLTEANGSTVLSVDADGALNGARFVALATLTGVTGLDVNTMLANENLEIA